MATVDTRPVPANFHPQQSSKQEIGNINKCIHEAKKSIKRKELTLSKFECLDEGHQSNSWKPINIDKLPLFNLNLKPNHWGRGENTVLGIGGSHKWVTQVFTEGDILAGEQLHLAKDNNRSLSSLPKPPWLVPKEVWWKPNTQACVFPSYTEFVKSSLGRIDPYL